MALFGRKKDDGDTLVLDENEHIYNPPRSDAPQVLEDDTDTLPEEDEDYDSRKGRKGKSKGRKNSKRVQAEEPEEEIVEEEEPADWLSPVKPSFSLPSRLIVEQNLKAIAKVRVRKIVIIAGAGLLAAGITCAGLNIYSAAQVQAAKNNGATLQNSLSSLQPVADFYDGYTKRRAEVTKALTKDVSYSSMQTSLSKVASKNGVTVKTETVAPGAACAVSVPFAKPSEGLGCVTLSLEAANASSIVNMAVDLNKETGLSDANVGSLKSDSSGKTTASATFSYNSNLLTDRYRKFADTSGQSTGGSSTSTTTGGK